MKPCIHTVATQVSRIAETNEYWKIDGVDPWCRHVHPIILPKKHKHIVGRIYVYSGNWIRSDYKHPNSLV